MKKVLVGSALGLALALTLSISVALADENTAKNVDNGAGSENTAIAGSLDVAVIAQSNEANIGNLVVTDANTGGNTANGNTGGNVLIDADDATANATVVNKANSNVANISCGCETDTNKAVNDHNGAGSENLAAAVSVDIAAILQSNTANVGNAVITGANTGDNKANWNTGGTTTVKTGKATANAKVKTKVNKNKATIGP